MKLKAFCEAFCAGMALTEVPIGYAVRTPFKMSDGDPVGMYLRRLDGQSGIYRIEDDGLTAAALEEAGIDLDNDARFQELQKLLVEYDCQYDDEQILLHTEYVEEGRLPAVFFKFCSLLLRIQDLALLASERVRKTFLSDLQDLVERHFSLTTDVQFMAQVDSALKDYVADIVMKKPDGNCLALFAGTSEVKALESLLLANKLREEKRHGIRSMLVVESAKPKQIKERTFSRIINSDVLLASMDGMESAITAKIAECLALSHPTVN
jgi:hypothetical protein